MDLKECGPAAIADAVALYDGGWFVIVADKSELTECSKRIFDELTFLAEDEGELARPQSIVAPREAGGLVRSLAGLTTSDVVIVTGIEDMSPKQLRRFDEKRNALLNGPRILFITTHEGAVSLAAGPNNWSWMAGEAFKYKASEGRMNVIARLESLRQGFKMTDEQVLKLSAEGALPNDPAFVEWLILLGHGEEVRRGG